MLMPSGDHTLSTKVLADIVQNEWVSPCWQSQHVRPDDSLGGGGGCSVRCSVFSSILVLCLLDASSKSPRCDYQKYLQTLPNIPREAEPP